MLKYIKSLFIFKNLTPININIKKEFNIDEFNEWFKYEFTGYGGRKGAIGIFLRTDKLSSIWIKEYLELIDEDLSYESVEKFYQIVRKDWRNKLSK